MRSLFIISVESPYGGAERSIEIIADHLQRDVKLTVFAASSKHVAALRNILRPPSRVIRLRNRGRLWGTIVWPVELSACLALYRPDAILTNTSLSARVAARAACFMPGISRRMFIYVRDFAWTDFQVIFKRLQHAHVLIPGPAILDRPNYLADHIVPRGTMRWTIVANAVCVPDHVTPSETSDGYVLHLATSNLWKGHYHLIRTAALLRDRGLPMRFISRGSVHNAPLWANHHRLISRWGLGKLFALWDSVDDPSDLLRDSLCVVVASISQFGGPESFGRTIIEAWAHRKPVVAFDAGGAHYLIEHGRDGLLVPEGNVAGLADALQSLKQNPALARRLGENGFSKVQRLFVVGKVAAELRAVLEI
jgi:glycosyltransferase involved in cell wall biosynthesis